MVEKNCDSIGFNGDLIRFNVVYGDFMGFDADLMGLKLNGVFF